MNSAQVKTAQRNKNMLVQVAQQQEQQGEQGERTAIQGSTGSTLVIGYTFNTLLLSLCL